MNSRPVSNTLRPKNGESSTDVTAKLSNFCDVVVSQVRREENMLKLIEKDIDKRRRLSYSQISSSQRLVERDLYQLRLAQQKHMEERLMRENSTMKLEEIARDIRRDKRTSVKQDNDDKWKFLLWGIKPQKKASNAFLHETYTQINNCSSNASSISSGSPLSSPRGSPRCSPRCSPKGSPRISLLPVIHRTSPSLVKRQLHRQVVEKRLFLPEDKSRVTPKTCSPLGEQQKSKLVRTTSARTHEISNQPSDHKS